MDAVDKPEILQLEDIGKGDEHLIEEQQNAILAPCQLSALQTVFKFWRGFLTGVLASLGGMYIGYTFSAMSNIVANHGFIETFGTVVSPKTGARSLNAQYLSYWTAIQTVSQIVFQSLSPFVIDRFGRKVAMWGLLIWMVIVSTYFHGIDGEFIHAQAIVLEIVGTDWKIFAVAKMFSGFASGWLGPAYMTYMSEVGLPQYRGALLCVFYFSFKLGSFVNAVACEIVNKKWPMEYRRVFYSEFFFVAVLTCVCIYLPESPMWLIRKGSHEKAKRSLRRIFGRVDGWDIDVYYAELVDEVRVSNEADQQSESDWKVLFSRVNFKRCVAAAIPFSGQQFAGVPYITNYTTYFFQLAGVSEPFLGNVIIQTITLGAVFSSFFLVEKAGRRRLLLVGLAAMAILNLLIGGLGFLRASSKTTGGVLITLCSLWEVAFGVSLGPLGWLGLVEVSSLRLRAKTTAFGVLINSFVGLAFGYCTPLLLSAQYAGWGQKIGLFFGGLSVLYWLPCYFLYPETKGQSYAEIDELFNRRVSPRKFAETKTWGQQVQEVGKEQTPAGDVDGLAA
ncbi:general substrate transporter [Naematelia encephala]|uniref:General substrate transporter n=1 Tax=Naematelia encephala TaxID=71784 RepID=A0A1Y2AXD4_9TREE|nr:general substrate transporter [Naematelia encephala]